jgi:hypothetical protein
VQNGADILAMPEKKLVFRHYLDSSVLPALEEAYQGEREHFLIYSGYEHGDFCYYCPERFSPPLLTHLETIQALSPEPWKALASFAFESPLRFPLAKCLGSKESMQRVNQRLSEVAELSATLIHDPLGEEIYLNLVTCQGATKGHALRQIQALAGHTEGLVIAAGDDLNDISMLHEADVKIVMATAPQEMHALAHILAPPSDACGIITALKQVT